MTVISIMVVAAVLYGGTTWIKRWIGLSEIRKADVILQTVPQTGSAARAGCPIPLPLSASNIQYAVWSFGQVTQSWIRFEAPVEDCLGHAERMLAAYTNREGWAVSAASIAEDTGVLCVLDPTEVDLSWFEDCQSGTGLVFRVSGGRAPVIWVDTNQGCFYCEIKNELHSLCPP